MDLCLTVKVTALQCGDSSGNTIMENYSVFFVIWLHWLPSAKACRQ